MFTWKEHPTRTWRQCGSKSRRFTKHTRPLGTTAICILECLQNVPPRTAATPKCEAKLLRYDTWGLLSWQCGLLTLTPPALCKARYGWYCSCQSPWKPLFPRQRRLTFCRPMCGVRSWISVSSSWSCIVQYTDIMRTKACCNLTSHRNCISCGIVVGKKSGSTRDTATAIPVRITCNICDVLPSRALKDHPSGTL